MRSIIKFINPLIFGIVLVGVFLFVGTSLAAWTPPIGIPTPPFPSDLDVARPSPPSPWTSEVAGNYYIDHSAGGCSDSRTYGTPSAPRCTLPTSPAAGSKIYVNGTYSVGGTISWVGTSANPIWLTYYDNTNRPLFTGVSPTPLNFNGSYIIVDGIRSDLGGATNDGVEMSGNNLMIRDSTFRNTYGKSNGAGLGTSGSNLVFYKDTVYDQGDWQYVGADIDRHGFKVSPPTNGLWILDSLIYHVQGDGVQVGDYNNTPDQINRVFIGRNTIYENLQTCLWTKNATDVIFSQNICYNITAPGSHAGDGQGLGGQYDPKNVWFIANTIHDTEAGIKISGSSRGGGGPWYAIGNVLYNIISNAGCNAWDMGALSYRNEGGFYGFYNTIYNADSFISVVPSNSGAFRNNIFSHQYTLTGCPAINDDGYGTYALDYNLWDTATPILKYNGTIYSSLAALNSATGQETHRVVGDPLLINPPTNMNISYNSPAIDKANPIEETVFAVFQSRYGVDIRKDFVGSIRPNGIRWDIGAYEYISGVSDTTPPAAPTGLTIN